jgi:hypothetical protein
MKINSNEMITKFEKLFENKINIDDIKVEIKNEDKKLIEKIKQELSIISYKKKNSPKTIRIKEINGYFNNTDFKKINLIYRTYINIKMSNDDDLKAKLSVFKDEKNINIKINNEIVYDIDNDNFTNEILVEKLINKYKEYLLKEYKKLR